LIDYIFQVIRTAVRSTQNLIIGRQIQTFRFSRSFNLYGTTK